MVEPLFLSQSIQTSGTCRSYPVPDLALVHMTQSLCPPPVTLDSTSSFTTEPRRAHDFSNRDQSPKNDHVFVTPPGFVPGFRGRALIFCKEGRPSSTNRGILVYCDRGRYYEAFADNNQVIISARRNDIEAYNYPREEPPPGFGPVTIEEGPFSGPKARHERVFGKLRASTS